MSEEYTGDCFHTWRVRRVDGRWRVAAQLVERFADLNDNAERLFATPRRGSTPESGRPGRQEHLDGAPLVHGRVAGRRIASRVSRSSGSRTNFMSSFSGG